MTKQKIKKILEAHKKWLDDIDGGERADLFGADLCGADLRYADLRYANLSRANLCFASLSDANLRGANLSCANLSDVDLRGANLRGVNLFGANLSNVNLFGAELHQTNLRGVNLYGVALDKKEKIRKGFIVQRKLTGWKKCEYGILVKLEIPKGAFVFSINNNKCRTNIAKVVEIVGGNGKIAISKYDNSFVYKLGKTIVINNFDCMYNVECSTGIHFFRTREEAENY